MKNHPHAPPDEVGYEADMDRGYINAQKKMKKHGTNVFVDAGKNWDWPPLLTKELQFS